MARKILLITFFVLLCSQLSAREILPVSAFASLPDVQQMKISPSGEKVASFVNVNTAEARGTSINILDIETGESSFPLYTDNEKFVFNWLRWANDRTLVFSARFPASRYGVPTTESRLLKLDIETGETESVLRGSFLRRLDWLPQFQDNIVDILPMDEEHILLSLSVDGPMTSRLYRVNLESRSTKSERLNGAKAQDWVTDRQHNLRIGISFDETTYEIVHRAPGEKEWNRLWTFESFSDEQIWPLGFDEDPNVLYVRAYHQGRYAIFRVNLADENLTRTLVFSDPQYDVFGQLVYSQLNRKVVGITYSQSGGYTFWDEEYVALQAGLNNALPETNNVILGFSADEKRYMVLTTDDNEPGTYYFGDRETKELFPIAYRYSDLSPDNLAEKKPHVYESRDGKEIEAFLTLPRDYTEGDQIPAVIFPHGGPISFDDDGFDYWTQFLANRGYAVLQMNFRGSAGYGYDFMKSGLQNWGLEMQNDVEDGTRWLIESGLIDPARICVVGASYGGYAALMEAARNPDLYQCVVSFAGVTDVASLVRSHRRYTSYEIVKEQIGSDFRELKNRSPINLVDEINIPVLLVHGTKDRSVRSSHSEKMYSALRRRDKDVTYIEQKDGDHHLSNEVYRLEFFTALDEFLRSYLVN